MDHSTLYALRDCSISLTMIDERKWTFRIMVECFKAADGQRKSTAKTFQSELKLFNLRGSNLFQVRPK